MSELSPKTKYLAQRLKEAEEVIAFYANRFSYDWSGHHTHEYYAATVKNDDSLIEYTENDGDVFECVTGGKRAREYFERYGVK